MIKQRATYLLVTEINVLNIFGQEIKKLFTGQHDIYGTYLVGSSLTTSEWRDIDVRTILSDETYDLLKEVVDIGAFNHIVSMWGQKITGLPIDYQVQSIGSSDNNGRKHPIDMLTGYVNGDRRPYGNPPIRTR